MAYNDFPGGITTYGVFAQGQVGDSPSALGQKPTVVVGETVWVAVDFTAFASAVGGTCELIDFPANFTATNWLVSPDLLTLPQSSQTWSSGPIQSTTGDIISLGTPVDLSGTYKYWVLWEGSFTSAGTASFEVEFDATNAAGPTSIPFSVSVSPAPPPNFAIPMACQQGTVGWEPEFSAGKLEFNDNGGYTIPNYAVRFTASGPFELHVASLSGDDVEVISGTVAYPRIERKRVARMSLQMLFGADPAGSPHPSIPEGMVTNWATVRALSDLTVSDTQGLQSITYTPYIGATPVTFDAHVLPPIVGEVREGVGMTFGLVIEVPDPSTLP